MYYIALIETNEEPMPLAGPYASYDDAVNAHYLSVVESGYEPDEGEDPFSVYVQDDAVRICRVAAIPPPTERIYRKG